MNFLIRQKSYIEKVDGALQHYLSQPDIPAPLRKSMQYSIFAGGKRLRPCLCLAACELVQGSAERALPFACALEMIHTYSLIHDDLPAMDNDDFRRGKPTNHKVFGEGQAILAGDGLLSLAFEVMLTAAGKDPALQQAALSIAKGAGVRGMVAGQCLDLSNEGKAEPDEALLNRIHAGKTAALIKASVEAGAFCAKPTDEEMAALQSFAEHFGLLFQITDDILDVTGNEAQLGKTVGKDQIAGKLTFAALHGVNGAREIASRTAASAQDALKPFGERAWYFQEIVTRTLHRDR